MNKYECIPLCKGVYLYYVELGDHMIVQL